MAIKFGEIRKYLSRVVRLSICFEDGHYDNYMLVSDIPKGKYDDLFVFGVGMIDVEFPLDVYTEPTELPQRFSRKNGFFLGSGLEIVLYEQPRDIKRMNEETLTFGDLRDYLQHGRNFSIVTKEDWLEEYYEWRIEIPEEYNDMYVYGIGIEDNPEEIIKCAHTRLINFSFLLDSSSNKRMRIVLSDNPRD